MSLTVLSRLIVALVKPEKQPPNVAALVFAL
jgi:hypothetical protein